MPPKSIYERNSNELRGRAQFIYQVAVKGHYSSSVRSAHFLIFTVFLFFNNFRPFIILNFD